MSEDDDDERGIRRTRLDVRGRVRTWAWLPTVLGMATAGAVGCQESPQTCDIDLTCPSVDASVRDVAKDPASTETAADGPQDRGPEAGTTDAEAPGDGALTVANADGGSREAQATDSPGSTSATRDAARDIGAPGDAASSVAGDGADSALPLATDALADALSLPSGWQPVIYSAGAAPCPSGFNSHAVVQAATATPGACSCSCQMSAAPTCARGTLATSFGAQCAQAGVSLNVTSAACTPLRATLDAHFGAFALPPQGGACASAVQTDPSQVTKTPGTYCDVPVAPDAIAAGPVPAGFVSCITASGAADCPVGSFTQRQVVEDDVVLVCSSCDPCTFTASCNSAVLSLFTDDVCTSLATSVAVNGTCVATGATGTALGSVAYSAQVNATCTAGSSSATIQPVNTRTICCLPG